MERKYRKNKSENFITITHSDNFYSGINMTKKAVEDYYKLFNNSLSSYVTCEPKKNWHKQKYLNKQREIKKRAKTDYPKYITNKNRSDYNVTEFEYDNPIIEVYYQKCEQVVGRFYHDEYQSFSSLKNKEGITYYQRKHSSVEDCEKEFTEIVYVYYEYIIKFKNNKFTFCSNKILDQCYEKNEQSFYTKEELILLIRENLKHIFNITISFPYSKRFKKKSVDIFHLVNNIGKIRERKLFYRRTNDYDSSFYKKNPHYKSLMKEIDKEINFYSGMRRKSNGKTKYNKIIKDIVHNYNSISSLENFDNYEIKKEILYNDGDFAVPFICDCELCIESFGEPIVIDNDLLINYECLDSLLVLENLYTNIKNNYESWDYIW